MGKTNGKRAQRAQRAGLAAALQLYGGSQARLARALELTRQAVSQWKARHGEIPEVYARRLVDMHPGKLAFSERRGLTLCNPRA